MKFEGQHECLDCGHAIEPDDLVRVRIAMPHERWALRPFHRECLHERRCRKLREEAFARNPVYQEDETQHDLENK